MKRRIQICALACAFIYTPILLADSSSLFNFGVNTDHAKIIIDLLFNRLDQFAEKFFKISVDGKEITGDKKSAAQAFIMTIKAMAEENFAELKHFTKSFAKTCAFMGMTGFFGSLSIYSWYKAVLECIHYKYSDNELKRKKLFASMKYHAIVALGSTVISAYSGYSLKNVLENLTRTLPAPSAQ
jgi:hypothetical protein